MDDLAHILHGSGELCFLPSSGVTLHAETIAGASEVRKTNAVTGFRFAIRAEWLRPPQDEMVSVGANVHSFRDGALLEEFGAGAVRELVAL